MATPPPTTPQTQTTLEIETQHKICFASRFLVSPPLQQ